VAQTQLDLYNLALSAMGSDYSVASLTEQSLPAEACNLWYENTRLTVMRAAHWNSCKRFERLVKAASRETETDYTADSDVDWQSGDPEPGFAFSYNLPGRFIAARYLTDYSQFTIGANPETGEDMLSCNIGGPVADDAPVLCYTYDQQRLDRWEPDLYQAMVYGLAGHIVMPLSGKPDRAQLMFNLANQFLLDARARTANERHQLFAQTPERLQARGYSYTPVYPFIQSYGNLFSGSGASTV
jgi:hypothetical protein